MFRALFFERHSSGIWVIKTNTTYEVTEDIGRNGKAPASDAESDTAPTGRDGGCKRGSHVAYLETGRRRPSLALLKRLADVLELDRWQLFLLAHPEAKSLLSSRAAPAPLEDPTKAWQRFVSTRTLRARYHITRREIQALKHLSLLGYVLTELEFLAVLTLIRQPGDG